MRKLLFGFIAALLFCFTFSIPAALAGQYDGVWYSSTLPSSYFMIRQTDANLLVVTRLADNGGWWEAFAGALSGSSARISTVISEVSAGVTIQFHSTTSATAVVDYCSPSYDCDLPTGASLGLTRLF